MQCKSLNQRRTLKRFIFVTVKDIKIEITPF